MLGGSVLIFPFTDLFHPFIVPDFNKHWSMRVAFFLILFLT